MYRELIKSIAPSFNPAHVEAWMRLEHDTLDCLSPRKFRSEVRVACQCIEQSTQEQTLELVRSMGLCAS
jgi:hypothetical protein